MQLLLAREQEKSQVLASIRIHMNPSRRCRHPTRSHDLRDICDRSSTSRWAVFKDTHPAPGSPQRNLPTRSTASRKSTRRIGQPRAVVVPRFRITYQRCRTLSPGAGRASARRVTGRRVAAEGRRPGAGTRVVIRCGKTDLPRRRHPSREPFVEEPLSADGIRSVTTRWRSTARRKAACQVQRHVVRRPPNAKILSFRPRAKAIRGACEC
jgi:hypothetical protein